MLSQWLVIVGRGFQTKDHLGQILGHLDGSDLGQQLLKSLDGIVKDQSPPKRLPGGRTKEGMVLFLGDIDPNDQMVLRSPDLFLEEVSFWNRLYY
jgi:hypothetical protein